MITAAIPLEDRLDYTTILVTDDAVTQDARIRTITLNRPERRNAMTPEMQAELTAAMRDAVSGGCRVLVFTGSGEAFCSGLDLSVLRSMSKQPAAEHHADAERVAMLFRTLYELPIPTIAAVHGPAIAGGTGLATMCDFTFATPAARFGYSEARIGFVPAMVSAYLSLQLGDKRSRELLLTGRIFDAAEAFRLGLVTEVVAAEDLAGRVRALAESLIANSPQALSATKRLLVAQNKAWLDAAIEAGLAANAQARETDDFREGVAAFLEKRKPVWRK